MFDLFSVIGEAIDPGPVGTIEASAPDVKYRPRSSIIVHFVFAFGLFTCVIVALCYWCWGYWGWLSFSLCMLAVYLVAAYYLTPSPDYDNMGWFGGWFDNWFRYSDDLNWYLLYLKILLAPGTFLMLGMRDGILLMLGRMPKKKRKKKKKLKEQDPSLWSNP